MIINCPNCDARYLVQSDSIGDGKKVRCANCKHVWVEKKKEEDAKTEEPGVIDVEDDGVADVTNADFASARNQDAEEDMDSIFASMMAAQKNKSIIATSFLLVLIFLIVGYGFIALKPVMTNTVPGMQSVYAVIGMAEPTLNQDSLVFDRVEVLKDPDLGGFVVSGFALNLTEQPIKLPNVEVNLLDNRGLIIGESEVFSFEGAELPAEESQFFEYLVKTEEKPADIELKFVYAKPSSDATQQE